jgi:ATP-dependent helicase IRC3
MIVSMATGSGKTVVFSQLYEDLKSRLPGKMLVLAHTEELVDQNIKTLREINPTLRIDKEMAKHKADPSKADIIVASVASLGRKGTSRVLKYNWDEWDKVIVDEAHHTPADHYRNILDCAGMFRLGTHKLLLGVTATTQRSDGKALGEFFKRISYVYSLRQAIDDGWLVDVKGYRVDTTTNLADVGNTGDDFNKNELGDKINNPERNSRVVAAWLKLGQDRQTVVFAASIDHAQKLAAAFTFEGVHAEAIWGDDLERAQKLKRHKEKTTRILVNMGVLVEGYDDWQIACIVHARPTKSECLFTQMTGRGTRLQEDTGNLKDYVLADGTGWIGGDIKQDCIIIDVVDNTDIHSLMTLPSLMGLPNGLNLNGESAVGAKRQLDELQEKHPKIDFKDLTALSDAEQFIEQVNLFEVRFPAEVEANSELMWFKTMDGYRMTVPAPAINKVGEPLRRGEKGGVTIQKNVLGTWDVRGRIKDCSFHGIRGTMEEAFVAADNIVREKAGQLLSFMNRKGTWQGDLMIREGKSAKQFKLLSNLYPGRKWPEDTTKGQASFWIDKKIGKKVTK